MELDVETSNVTGSITCHNAVESLTCELKNAGGRLIQTFSCIKFITLA